MVFIIVVISETRAAFSAYSGVIISHILVKNAKRRGLLNKKIVLRVAR